jgi:hypothetical protein
MELIPEARELTLHAANTGHGNRARAVNRVIDEILARPEHKWFQEGAEEQAARIREEMERRYGQGGESR